MLLITILWFVFSAHSTGEQNYLVVPITVTLGVVVVMVALLVVILVLVRSKWRLGEERLRDTRAHAGTSG